MNLKSSSQTQVCIPQTQKRDNQDRYSFCGIQPCSERTKFYFLYVVVAVVVCVWARGKYLVDKFWNTKTTAQIIVGNLITSGLVKNKMIEFDWLVSGMVIF